MILKTRMLGQTYEFKDVKDVLAKASEKKSGDELAGVGAESALERIAAKEVLAQLTVADLTEHPVVPYEEDAVTRIIQDDIDETVYGTIKDRTIQEMREWILCDVTDSGALMRASRGMTSEVIAGISKIMSNMDLILAGSKIRVTATCNTTIGTENVLASRLQPNHPVDDVEGVAASTLEGLSYGIGDAVIGLNPAIDTVDSTLAIWKVLGDIRDKYEIPTQTCVLSHVTTQMEALRTGQGSADLCFQSIAGSEAALSAFGINTGMLSEAEMLFREEGPAKGPNVMYFETGQGSELSSSAAFEVLIGVILNHLGSCGLTAPEIAQVGQYAENVYFGKPCGLMDQTASAVGNIIGIDFADPAHPKIQPVAFDFASCGYSLCIIDSGASHSDLTDCYAAITEELKTVCRVFGKEVLRDVPEDEFYARLGEVRQAAGDRAVLRAIHVYEDNKRVRLQLRALENDNFPAFLEYVKESGDSSWMYLQNVIPEGRTAHQEVAFALALAKHLLGGHGACRVHGGGFAGTIQAFVPNEQLEEFRGGIEAVLGEGSCHVLSIRPEGGILAEVCSHD